MKLVLLVGVIAAAAAFPGLPVEKRDALEDLQKRNSSDCFVCPAYHYMDDAPCYPYHWFCDGFKDCPSGLDEAEELCGEYERDIDEVVDDIMDNSGRIIENIAIDLFTDKVEYLEAVHDGARDALAKIDDVLEEVIDDNWPHRNWF